MDFSITLKELREEKNLTQKELAKACKLSPQCISALENGINSPTATTLSAIANYFGLPIDEIIGHTEITPKERAAGASKTKKISITPIEDEMLYTFRKIGKKHGIAAQRALITVAEKML